MQYRRFLFVFLTLSVGALCAQKPGLTPREYPAPTGIRPPPPRPDPTLSPLNWRVRDRVLQAGSMEDIDFVALNFTDIAAYQFALRFDTAALHFEQIEILTTAIPLDPDGNFGLYSVQAGEIRTLWSAAKGLSLPPATKVFRLQFTVKTGGKKLSEALALAPDVLSAVAYNSVLADKSIHLLFADYYFADPRRPETADGYSPAMSCGPNPFTAHTVIRFFMPEAGMARLQLTDSAGHTLVDREKWYPAGDQQEILGVEQLPSAGVFYCTWTARGDRQTIVLLRQ